MSNAVSPAKRFVLPRIAATLLMVALIGACQSLPEIQTASNVDLDRFSGDWYVIASQPTFIERQAYAAVESYAKPVDGRIETTFSFNQGGFDGERKIYRPTGYIEKDGSNAVWGMQFVWPFKAEYRIVYVDEHYEQTIIGRTKRDYVWIMARTPQIPEADMQKHLQLLQEQGYDISQIRMVPQQPGQG